MLEDPYGPYDLALDSGPAAPRGEGIRRCLYGGAGAAIGTALGLTIPPLLVKPRALDGGGSAICPYLPLALGVGLIGALCAAALGWCPWRAPDLRGPTRASFAGAAVGFATCLVGAVGAASVWTVIGRASTVPAAFCLVGVILTTAIIPWVLSLRLRPLGKAAALVNIILLGAAACVATGVRQGAILNAAASGSVLGTQAWIALGCDPDATDEAGATPLHYAAASGNTLLVALLVEHGASVDATDRRGRTPLHLAAREGREAMVTLLLSWDADTTIVDAGGKTALRLARERGHIGIVTLLRAHATQPPRLPHDSFLSPEQPVH